MRWVRWFLRGAAMVAWLIVASAAVAMSLGNPIAVNAVIGCGIWAVILTALTVWEALR